MLRIIILNDQRTFLHRKKTKLESNEKNELTLPLFAISFVRKGEKKEKKREREKTKFQNSHSSIIPPSFPHFSIPVLGKMAAKGHHSSLPPSPSIHPREPSNILTRAVYRGLLERKTKRARTYSHTERERERDSQRFRKNRCPRKRVVAIDVRATDRFGWRKNERK